MNQQSSDLESELKHLQRCMNDLVSVLALPAVWAASDPDRILQTFLDALLGMLNLDFLYVRVRPDPKEPQIDALKTTLFSETNYSGEGIKRALSKWFAENPQQWPEEIFSDLKGEKVRVFSQRMGIQGELGLIVAGSQRADFPEQTERLVLSVAANQTAVGLQQAWLLMEQKRVASELDRRVAQRTEELDAVNEELRKEIADHKRAAEDLSASEEMHRVIIEAANDAVISMDEKGTILLANPSAKRIFGYTQPELVGKPMTVLMPEMMRKLHDNGLKRYLTTGKRNLNWQGVEVTAKRKDGQEFPVEVSFGELVRDTRKVFTGFIRDISERKQAEDKLRASERNLQMTQAELVRVSRLTTMGELAASIAHEVNQPLTAVINNASACLRLLANRNLEPEVLRVALEGITADGARASNVLARIRAFIKKEAAEKIALNINEVIQEVLVLAGGELNKNEVLVEHELTADLPLVSADRVQLQQIMLNLIVNGIEALIAVPDRSRLLRVQSRIDEAGDVLVTVSDSGPGFGAEMDRVFTPFFTTKADGMGMGLSISRSLVESHGGRLWAKPNFPSGAVFSFTLPAISEDPS